MIRESFKACANLPADERLALYARGNCEGDEGRTISRSRFALAGKIRAKLLREVRAK